MMFQFSVWVHESSENYADPFHAKSEWECIAESKYRRLAIVAAENEMATNPRRYIQVWKLIAPGQYMRVAGYDPAVAEVIGMPRLKIHV